MQSEVDQMNMMQIDGLKIYKGSAFSDSRGKFSRVFDSHWFSSIGFTPMQINVSSNPYKRTLRGMHFQVDGEPENKLMTLLSGVVFLSIVDLRPKSISYLNVFTREVSSEELESIYIPAGCAAGWISLSNDVHIHYVMSSRFELNNYDGFRFDDSFFSIPWPVKPEIISDQDRNWPIFKERS
jgi:dTDP-4-dehydrorhamnose 3,5-epimerase